MANKSDWKGFEKMVAEVVGGKRRLRTMESFGKEATDVYFPKKVRRLYPLTKKVAIECKKRRNLNIHALFVEALCKYGEEGAKHLILASKIPRHGNLEQAVEKAKQKVVHSYRVDGPVHKGMLKSLRRKRKKEGKDIRGKDLKRVKERLLGRMKLQCGIVDRQTRAKYSITPLVTVELKFFGELFHAWLKEQQ